MCFILHPKHPKEKTAKRDIPCYKKVKHCKSACVSPFFIKIYEYGKTYSEVPLKATDVSFGDKSKREIGQGFHSFSSKRAMYMSYYNSYTTVRCIIPKGAHYYYNPGYQEYVSDQIKILGPLEKTK